jgi:hypothetical protein
MDTLPGGFLVLSVKPTFDKHGMVRVRVKHESATRSDIYDILDAKMNTEFRHGTTCVEHQRSGPEV